MPGISHPAISKGIKMKKGFWASAKNKAAAAGTLLVSTGVAFAQEGDGGAAAAITSAQTTILALVAAAGAAYIAVALASTGWETGAKLIKRIKGKA